MHANCFRLAVLGAVSIVFLAPGMVHTQCFPPSSGPQVESPPPPKVVQGFIEAMRTPGENARVAAVREYLSSVLETGDWRTRRNLRDWLNGMFAVVDPAPYEDLLEKLGCNMLLDMADLRRSRTLQLEVFGKALDEGRAFLPRGTALGGNAAVIRSAEYGLEELRDTVARFYSHNWLEANADSRNVKGERIPGFVALACEDIKKNFTFETFELDLRLHAGGKDYEDANRLAAKRLAEMPAAELRGYMMKTPGFDAVLWRIASYACSINTFTGQQSPACLDVMKAYVHERWLMEDLDKAGESVVWPKGFAALGWCYIDHVPFGDYVVPPRDFLSPAHMRILDHSREELRKRREKENNTKNQGDVTR